MNGFIAKVARLAVSKAAAFGYAVAVGVAGNIAFNYVQPHAPPAGAAATVATRSASDGAASDKAASDKAASDKAASDRAGPAPSEAAAIAPAPVSTAATPHPPPARPKPAAAMPAPARPAEPHRSVATAPVLPEPPTVAALPEPAALPAPALKPAALPSEAPLHPAAPAIRPSPITEEGGVAMPAPAPVTAAAPAAAVPVALPPLGPAIEVTAAPTPPTVDAPTPSASIVVHAPAGATKAAAAVRDDGLALSDLWHPGRAVRRGLHWAGRQVPLIGDSDDTPVPRAAVKTPHAAVAAPIPLLPAANEASAAGQGVTDHPSRKSAAPGPGSGGLY